MSVISLPLDQVLNFDPIIQHFIKKSPLLIPFLNEFATEDAFSSQIQNAFLSEELRNSVVKTLSAQYEGLKLTDAVANNIQSLKSPNTFTITTGHQLCLFTGPLYSIFKIASTIALAKRINGLHPDKKIVPVFWMASEDHDLEEINHVFLYHKKLVWNTAQTGAVGQFNNHGIGELIDQLESVLGVSSSNQNMIRILRSAYELPTLADATRYIMNALFGDHGLVVLDAQVPELKRHFIKEFKNELFESKSYHAVSKTNEIFASNNWRTQVNPRQINLFYLKNDVRNRIERSESGWFVVDTDFRWNEKELLLELDLHPERFSPNVIMRPIYQEKILPNLAYIGGPGEIAYWLQLKAAFEAHQIQFPLLVLRDSALLINEKMNGLMSKLQMKILDLFIPKNELIRRLTNADEVSLQTEKHQITEYMNLLHQKMIAIDPTLGGAVQAEIQKMSTGIDNLEKKAIKSLKQREEVKLTQLEKLLAEVFPDGALQERHDNFFQFHQFADKSLIETLIQNFNPLENHLSVISMA